MNYPEFRMMLGVPENLKQTITLKVIDNKIIALDKLIKLQPQIPGLKVSLVVSLVEMVEVVDEVVEILVMVDLLKYQLTTPWYWVLNIPMLAVITLSTSYFVAKIKLKL